MERKALPLYHQNIAIACSGKDTLMQSRLLHSGCGKSDVPETPVKSSSIVHAKTYFDTHYLWTFSGLLKIIEMMCMLIAFILAATAWSTDWRYGLNYCIKSAEYVKFATITGFIITLILLILYLIHMIDPLYQTNWLLAEGIYCGIVDVLVTIAGAVMIPYAEIDGARGACAFFCLSASLLYGAEFLFKSRSWRDASNQPCYCDPAGFLIMDKPERPFKFTKFFRAILYFDVEYLKTPPGIRKIVELVCTFIAFVASLCTYYLGDIYATLWTNITTPIAFVATLAFLIVHLSHLVDTFHAIPWNTIEVVYSLVALHCMLFAGAIMMPYADALAGTICVLFCWSAAIVYGVDAFFYLQDMQIFTESSSCSNQYKDLEETKAEDTHDIISSKDEATDFVVNN
ncbi:uncharacterized protein LOC129593892 [Paramacrobiotus metropolitanus]|uniref:uncharacterized protein LOC129593892 n=1 Tax=Paramacrobiotus metropolitanus TaxID=2943436 RepID=UPI0024463977|nr:uncharacterized protein LOC129593892 [Paramacrobiotus metropolitanus]